MGKALDWSWICFPQDKSAGATKKNPPGSIWFPLPQAAGMNLEGNKQRRTGLGNNRWHSVLPLDVSATRIAGATSNWIWAEHEVHQSRSSTRVPGTAKTQSQNFTHSFYNPTISGSLAKVLGSMSLKTACKINISLLYYCKGNSFKVPFCTKMWNKLKHEDQEAVCSKWGLCIKERHTWSKGICKLIIKNLLKALMRKLGVFFHNITSKKRCFFPKKTLKNTSLQKEQIPFAKSQHLQHAMRLKCHFQAAICDITNPAH